MFTICCIHPFEWEPEFCAIHEQIKASFYLHLLQLAQFSEGGGAVPLHHSNLLDGAVSWFGADVAHIHTGLKDRSATYACTILSLGSCDDGVGRSLLSMLAGFAFHLSSWDSSLKLSIAMVWWFGALVLCGGIVRGQENPADIEVLSHICKYGLHNSGGRR